MSRASTPSTKSGLDLAEETLHLVRSAPLHVIAAYYAGAVPFAAGAVTFWGAMAHSAHAHAQLPAAALALAPLFLWMKYWQARYAQALRAVLTGTPPAHWSWSARLRVFARQGLVHATGAAALPIALIIMLPLPYLYALYQSATVCEDGGKRTLRDLLQEAHGLAKIWPAQNIFAMWLFSPLLLITGAAFFLGILPAVSAMAPMWSHSIAFLYAFFLAFAIMALSPVGVMIVLNLGLGFFLAAQLLASFTGVQTLFTNAPVAAFNSTFVMILAALGFLCLDPLMKAAYVLRAHQAASLRTGEDIRAALQRLRKAAAAALLLCCAALPAVPAHAAAPPALDPEGLDRAIDETLRQAAYSWRMPRETLEHSGDNAVLQMVRAGIEFIEEVIGGIFRTIEQAFERWFGGGAGDPRFTGGIPPDALRWLNVALIIVFAAVIALLLRRMWKQRIPRDGDAAAASGPPPAPDLDDASVTAADLPAAEWLALAEECRAKGEWRRAVRAQFLAMLAALAGQELLTIARFKTNREYLSELERRARALPRPPLDLGRGIRIYEPVWYGRHLADANTFERMQRLLEEATAHGTR